MSTIERSPADEASGLRRGLLSMLLAGLLFACGNAAAKFLADDYPIGEITFFRFLFSIVPVAALMALQGGARLLRATRAPLHALRAVLGLGSSVLFYVSLSEQSLGHAVVISYSVPLFLTALAVPLLGEKVGRYRWAAVLAGFTGVLVAAGPGGGFAPLGLAAGLASAALYAASIIATRRLTERDSPVTIAFWFMVGATALSGLSLPWGFVAPRPEHWPLLAFIGLGSGTAFFLVTQAFRDAPASVLGALDYLGLVWASLFDAVLWGHQPGLGLAGGGAIIVASGLFIVYRETHRRVRIVRAPWARRTV
jgi:drug/metabolite transporter (DMT)-like permease